MVYRAQVTFQGRSGIAEDQFVNTYYISATNDDIGAVAAQIGPMLASIYNAGDGSNNIASYYSNFIDRTAQGSQVRFYDMGEAKPRTPFIYTFTLGLAQAGTGDLPEEVALCSSFSARPPYTARRRGRVYLGPFNTGALGLDPSPQDYGPARPNNLLRGAIQTRFKQFRDQVDATPGYDWSIFSPTAGAYTKVERGWVDDAWDTQRRRGVDPSDKLMWRAAGFQ